MSSFWTLCGCKDGAWRHASKIGMTCIVCKSEITSSAPAQHNLTPTSKPSKEQVGGDHYKDMEIQPAHFCRVNKLLYHESNAIKYICRHQSKNGKQDIEKAIHYLQLLIEEDYSE